MCQALVSMTLAVHGGAECVELHLARRGIDSLPDDFQRFVSLECLWLNSNELEAVSGLAANFRLRELYIQDNRITTLAGSLSACTFLRVLDASNNRLAKLSEVLSHLSRLHFLEDLNLAGNGCCEETGYCTTVIRALPSLRILDHRTVSAAEHKAAQVCLSSILAVVFRWAHAHAAPFYRDASVSFCTSKPA